MKKKNFFTAININRIDLFSSIVIVGNLLRFTKINMKYLNREMKYSAL